MAADERPGVWRQGQGIQGRNRRHDRGCHNGGAEIRQSWARGSVMTQQRGEMHRRGCGGDAKPQCQLLDDVRQGIRSARLLGGTSANASELRAPELQGARQPAGEQDDRYHRVGVDGVSKGQPTMISAVSVPLTSSTRRKP
jgi:hypothetical protein